ncbi:hypothetical protein D9M72_639530 [compost metagenome]
MWPAWHTVAPCTCCSMRSVTKGMNCGSLETGTEVSFETVKPARLLDSEMLCRSAQMRSALAMSVAITASVTSSRSKASSSVFSSSAPASHCGELSAISIST